MAQEQSRPVVVGSSPLRCVNFWIVRLKMVWLGNNSTCTYDVLAGPPVLRYGLLEAAKQREHKKTNKVQSLMYCSGEFYMSWQVPSPTVCAKRYSQLWNRTIYINPWSPCSPEIVQTSHNFWSVMSISPG